MGEIKMAEFMPNAYILTDKIENIWGVAHTDRLWFKWTLDQNDLKRATVVESMEETIETIKQLQRQGFKVHIIYPSEKDPINSELIEQTTAGINKSNLYPINLISRNKWDVLKRLKHPDFSWLNLWQQLCEQKLSSEVNLKIENAGFIEAYQKGMNTWLKQLPEIDLEPFIPKRAFTSVEFTLQHSDNSQYNFQHKQFPVASFLLKVSADQLQAEAGGALLSVPDLEIELENGEVKSLTQQLSSQNTSDFWNIWLNYFGIEKAIQTPVKQLSIINLSKLIDSYNHAIALIRNPLEGICQLSYIEKAAFNTRNIKQNTASDEQPLFTIIDISRVLNGKDWEITIVLGTVNETDVKFEVLHNGTLIHSASEIDRDEEVEVILTVSSLDIVSMEDKTLSIGIKQGHENYFQLSINTLEGN